MSKIITFTQFKGGVGKTTAAICLASVLSGDHEVLLIDSDPNKSATLWARKGLLPFQVCADREAPRLISSGDFEIIIIDTPARPAADEIESLAKGCDLLILPCSPEPLALGALAQISRELPEGTNYKALLTLVPPKNQSDGEEALAALRRYNIPTFQRTIRRLKAHIKASDKGVTLDKIPNSGNARREWVELSKEVQNAL